MSMPPPPPGGTPPPPPPFGGGQPDQPYGGQPPQPYGQQQYPGQPAPPPPYGGAPVPPGYSPYGAPVGGQPKNNGLAVAGFVLSLVGIIPCFWVFQIPALLGLIFGIVSKRQIKASNGAQKGGGLATAALVIGIILVVVAIVLVIAIAASDNHCFHFGTGTNNCSFSS